ncbi:MAG TPA: dienelactone hydrolase family protein [Streptosporangiaceae bacterium]
MTEQTPHQNVTFPSHGGTGHGYLAMPDSGGGPGLIVIQEWWGLTDHIADVTSRFAREGFVALAPDLYGGRTTHDAGEASALMNELPPEKAVTELAGAVDYLLSQPAVTGRAVGVAGFCMGGLFALNLAVQAGGKVGATAVFYGTFSGDEDFSAVRTPVLGIVGGQDAFTPAAQARAVLDRISGPVDVQVYDAGHAFFNDENLLGTYDGEKAGQAWAQTVGFLRQHLAG